MYLKTLLSIPEAILIGISVDPTNLCRAKLTNLRPAQTAIPLSKSDDANNIDTFLLNPN